MSKRLYIGLCAASCAVTIAAGWSPPERTIDLQTRRITETPSLFIVRQGASLVVMPKAAMGRLIGEMPDSALVQHCAFPITVLVFAHRDYRDARTIATSRRVTFTNEVRT